MKHKCNKCGYEWEGKLSPKECPACKSRYWNKDVDVSKPDVYCEKERKRVPIWWCLGSLMQQRNACPSLVEARVNYRTMKAEVKCSFKEVSKSKTSSGRSMAARSR